MNLYEHLQTYQKQNILPMHMPGHKRNPAFTMDNPYSIDVTEVEGTDNLHHPEGVILALMEQMERLYGTTKSWPLVGGSTCGILTAVSACCKKGSVLLMDRGCHRSVYHACYLLGLEPEYLMPAVDAKSGIALGISAEEVKKGFDRLQRAGKKAAAVILTSPTYEGVLSDIEEIAQIVHEQDIPLIVDEAHGAHLPFFQGSWKKRYPSAVSGGADLVIQSLHKTLPALTQTAVLHLCSDRVESSRIDRYLDIYETSSPSYVLMSSIAQSMDYMEKEGEKEMESYLERLSALEKQAEKWKVLHLWAHPRKEPSKLVIQTGKSNFTGPGLAQILRRDYRIEVEMEASDYILAMTSVADGADNFSRLFSALWQIDTNLSADKGECTGKNTSDDTLADPGNRAEWKEKNCTDRTEHRSFPVSGQPVVRMRAYEAMEQATEDIFYRSCAGRISAAYVMVYPPGIPFLVPGEEITEEITGRICEAKKNKLRLIGLCGVNEDKLQVCVECVEDSFAEGMAYKEQDSDRTALR